MKHIDYEKPFLSIVIPVYNGLPYMKKLIDSIISQNVDGFNYEVVIIDDGSDDGTAEYCDSLESKYTNIRVFHQLNSGSPAGPRNLGIEYANGEYIFFADADDYFLPDAFKGMFYHAQKTNCDIGLFKVDGSDWNYVYGGLFDKLQINCTPENSMIINSLGPYKLFKRDLILDNNIMFPEGIHYEDLSFTIECYFNAKNIIVINDQTYYKYVKREDGKSLSQPLNTSAIFSKIASKLDGIKHYLNTVSKYRTVEDSPFVYLRAFRYSSNEIIHHIIKNKSLLNDLRNILKPYYCDAVRSVMPLKYLLMIDALMGLNYEALDSIVLSYPDGPIVEWSHGIKGKVSYTILSNKATTLLKGNLPEDHGFGRESLEAPTIFRTLITKAAISEQYIFFSGSSEILQRSKGKLTDGKICAVSKDSVVTSESINISNITSEKVYADVYKYTFDWEGRILCSDIAALNNTNDKIIVHFYLDIKLDNDICLRNRFGHNRKPDVFTTFIRNSMVYNNFIIAPTETSYKNLSVNLIPVDQVVQTPIVIEEKQLYGIKKKLIVTGNLNYDNYKHDIVSFTGINRKDNMVLFKTNLKKGKSRGNRNFSGSISLPLFFKPNDLDFEITVKTLNGELKYTNIIYKGRL